MEFKESYKYIKPEDYIKQFAVTDWYLQLQPELQGYFYRYDGNKEKKSHAWLAKRSELVKMVCELLEADKIALGSFGPHWDEERKPIETIVIHHSSTPPETSLQVINALGLIRLYAPFYSQKEGEHFGKPIWSNHFYKSRETFIAYHYIIRKDGSFEHTLQDNQIGWHCGNWHLNCRSIAICFLDDLKERRPSKKALRTAREIIKKYPNCDILGHKEIKPTTTCPGNLFVGKEGWRNNLLSENIV